jgi:uncharacterized membrane protein YczE
MARLLIIVGVVLVAVGVAMKLGLPIGRLPGDVVVKREHTSFYFPIVTCIVVSALLTLLAALIRK